MKPIPQRQTLVTQAAEYLRDALRHGEWTDFLPGSRALCDRLQISGYTLHQALMILQSEKLISIAHGRRIKVLRKKPPRATARTSSRMVVALTTQSLEEMTSPYCFVKLQHSLQMAGFELLVHSDPRLRWQNSPRRLEKLIRDIPAACWVLFSVNADVQRWFMERKVSAIISGTRHSGICLPAVESDISNLCHAAVDSFVSKGHTRLAYLAFKSETAGDQAMERDFVKSFSARCGSDGYAKIFHHNCTVDGICSTMAALWAAPNRPTGILVKAPGHTATAVSYLLSNGVKLPRDVSIISVDHTRFHREIVPSIAGFEFNKKMNAELLARKVETLARTGTLPAYTIKVPAKFIPGDTFGPI